MFFFFQWQLGIWHCGHREPISRPFTLSCAPNSYLSFYVCVSFVVANHENLVLLIECSKMLQHPRSCKREKNIPKSFVLITTSTKGTCCTCFTKHCFGYICESATCLCCCCTRIRVHACMRCPKAQSTLLNTVHAVWQVISQRLGLYLKKQSHAVLLVTFNVPTHCHNKLHHPTQANDSD